MSVIITNAILLQTIVATRRSIPTGCKVDEELTSAFELLPLQDKRAVNSVIKVLNSSSTILPLPKVTVSLADVTQAVEETSFLTGVPESYLFMTIRLENYKTRSMSGFIVDILGKHQGIGQFDKATWDAVMHPEPYTKVNDLNLSLLAIARLYERNFISFKNQGFKPEGYSDELAYLYHNQGAGSASRYLSSGILTSPDQSLDALRLFKKARSNYVTRTT